MYGWKTLLQYILFKHFSLSSYKVHKLMTIFFERACYSSKMVRFRWYIRSIVMFPWTGLVYQLIHAFENLCRYLMSKVNTTSSKQKQVPMKSKTENGDLSSNKNEKWGINACFIISMSEYWLFVDMTTKCWWRIQNYYERWNFLLH